MDYVIHFQYDSEAHVWTAVNDTIPLALESDSLDDLMGRVKTVAREIIELNHLPGLGQSIIDADDIATAEDIRLHGIARREFLSGETVSFQDINWN